MNIGNIGNIVISSMMIIEDVRINNKKIQKEILADWEKSKEYPRKKKKKVRKDLNFRWMVFSYDPYDYMSF